MNKMKIFSGESSFTTDGFASMRKAFESASAQWERFVTDSLLRDRLVDIVQVITNVREPAEKDHRYVVVLTVVYKEERVAKTVGEMRTLINEELYERQGQVS